MALPQLRWEVYSIRARTGARQMEAKVRIFVRGWSVEFDECGGEYR
jgi:hypothetical protein